MINKSSAFGAMQRTRQHNVAAILEWTIAFLVAIFMATFVMDFLPAVGSHAKGQRYPTISQMENARANGALNNLGGPTGYPPPEGILASQPMSQIDQGHYQEEGNAAGHTTSRNF